MKEKLEEIRNQGLEKIESTISKESLPLTLITHIADLIAPLHKATIVSLIEFIKPFLS